MIHHATSNLPCQPCLHIGDDVAIKRCALGEIRRRRHRAEAVITSAVCIAGDITERIGAGANLPLICRVCFQRGEDIVCAAGHVDPRSIATPIDEVVIAQPHGGHAATAGFTARADALDALQARLRAIAELEQPEGGWQRVLQADAEVALDQIDARAIADLQRLDPHGQGNPPPTLVVRAATVAAVRRVGRVNGQGDQPHLRLRLTDARTGMRSPSAWASEPASWQRAQPYL